MKRNIFVFVAVLLLLSLSLSMLVGCEGGVSAKEARATFDGFWAAIVAEDYEAAKNYMHPVNVNLDLEGGFKNARETYGIDLREGLSGGLKQVGVQAMLYHSDYKGAGHTMTFHAKTAAGEKPILISCTVVRNAEGYGIFSFNISGR